MKLIASLLLLSVCYTSAFSQDLSNKGKDFWVGYGYHVSYAPNGGSQDMVLYFATENVSNITVSIPGNGYTRTYTNVPANTILETDPIPKTGAHDARLTTEGVFNTGIHVVSDQPVVAYAHIYNASISGASLLFPTNTLGKDYYSINYTQKSNAANSNGFFFVIAADTGKTTVEITPAASTLTHPANVPFIVDLTQGQIYNVMGTLTGMTGVDLTGSRIRSISSGTASCKKIAVFSGSGKIYINCGSGQANSADNLFAQAFPRSAWGKKFLTAPTANMPYNYFRVAVSDPAAVVTSNGVPVTGLINNFYYDLPLTNQPLDIESNLPITVAQYITTAGSGSQPTCGNRVPVIPNDGDPEMIYLSPVEQTTNKVILNSTSHFAINQHWINVVTSNNNIGSVMLDGVAVASSFVTHPGDANYAYAQLSVQAGPHTLSADSGFNVIAYGYGIAESYGYNGGTNIKDLYQFISIINPNSIVNQPTACTGSPFYFSITLPYRPISLNWSFHDPARPDIYLANPVADTSYVTNGKTIYRFKLPALSTYPKGIYPITVTANNPTPDGCSGEQQIDFELNVYDPPVADFTMNTTGCTKDSVMFKDSSNLNGANAYKWYWDFGDGTYAYTKNPTHKYTTADTFKVRYAVLADIGCQSDTVTKTLYITNVPIAAFGISQPVCVGKPLTFSDSSTLAGKGVIARWFWNNDNGTTDSLTTNASRTYTYNILQTYHPTLLVESSSGCRSAVDTMNVLINPFPQPGFISPEVCLSDAFGQFTDSSKIVSGSIALWTWDFGDPGTGALDSSHLVNPQHRYHAIGKYPVNLTVTSGAGCVSSLLQTITVNGDKPQADFTPQNSGSLCANDSVFIKDNSTVNFGSVTRIMIFWDQASNPSAADTDFTPVFGKVYKHLYPNFQSPLTKTFKIVYRAFSGTSCVNEISKTVTVNAAPKVVFNTVPDVCFDAVPFQITEASETGNVPGSGVFTGAGVTASGIFDPVAAGVGTHRLLYTFTSSKGCIDTASTLVKVLIPPVANFGYSKVDCEKQDITFSDSSSSTEGTITKWIWDFGDGTPVITKTSAAPFAHVFAVNGSYKVKLTVVTDNNCNSAVVSQIVIVHAVPAPDFTVSKTCLPDANAMFTNTTTISDGSLSSITYAWDFGDPGSGAANQSKSVNPSHVYNALGNYTVALSALSNNGCRKDTSKIYNNIHPQPHAKFMPSTIEVCVGASISFTDQSDAVEGNVVSWKWDFGDGGSSTLQNPTYQFNTPGNLNVSLTITNSNGCAGDTFSLPVTIDAYPVVIAKPDRFVLQGDTIHLTPVYKGEQLTYLWSPPDYLSSTTVAYPVLTGVDDRLYTIVVTGKGECVSSDQVFVKVLKEPKVPNTFTPNGDGINDVWSIDNLQYYNHAHVQVFDRYGQQVFESNGYTKPWDGKYKGTVLPVGTYYYIIDSGNGRKPQTGYVTILK